MNDSDALRVAVLLGRPTGPILRKAWFLLIFVNCADAAMLYWRVSVLWVMTVELDTNDMLLLIQLQTSIFWSVRPLCEAADCMKNFIICQIQDYQTVKGKKCSEPWNEVVPLVQCGRRCVCQRGLLASSVTIWEKRSFGALSWGFNATLVIKSNMVAWELIWLFWCESIIYPEFSSDPTLIRFHKELQIRDRSDGCRSIWIIWIPGNKTTGVHPRNRSGWTKPST